MKKITLLCLTLFTISLGFSQSILSSEYIGHKSKQEIDAMIGIPLFQYGVNYYKLTYESTNAKGQPDVLSALLVVPETTENTYPVLFYEHGTSSCKECVPSRFEQSSGGDEGQAGLVFASMGYVALLPDYVGMGDGNGFQTYVHYETSVSASEDLLTAFRAWAPDNDILINEQLFITGYSQGGYASMAFHKAMQEKHGAEFVTAAAHNSGPYSLSGAMRDLILVDSSYAYPAYIPNTMLGMNEVYEMYPNVSDFFKPAFINDVQAYRDGTLELIDLNTRIIDTLVAYYGDTISHRMILDDVLEDIQNDPTYVVNQILLENDVYKWVPQSPTRIYYCQADDQVPYMNSVIAIDTMYHLGADPNLVKAEDLNSAADHAGCVQPAFMQALGLFGQYQNITVGTEEISHQVIDVYPNPANELLYVRMEEQMNGTLSVIDLNGKLHFSLNAVSIANGIDVSNLEAGMYLLQISSENGISQFKRFVVEH